MNQRLENLSLAGQKSTLIFWKLVMNHSNKNLKHSKLFTIK